MKASGMPSMAKALLQKDGTMMKKGYKTLLEEANAEIVAIPPEEVAALLEDDGTVVVDLRDPRELQRDGMIPGAQHCPRGMLEFWIDPESPYHKPVFASGKTFVFYCASGWRSALSTKTAQDMGLEPVKHIEGGFTAWKKAGLPVAMPEKKG
jgi:rhodanese-related sulfurtransferase